MSISTAVTLAYRCTKCWQMTCAESDQVGNMVPCVSCSTPTVVPEATSKTIEAGEQFAVSSEVEPPPQTDLNSELTDAQINQLAREKVREEMRASGTPATLACSRWKRLFGSLIDSFAGAVALIAGVILVALMGSLSGEGGRDPLMLVVLITFPAMLGICQLYMIAVDGRTVGKYCVGSKIVNLEGKPPGVFQGIVMRIVVIAFLGMIPMFGLVNICWIFNEPKRCLHDIIAGTYVIDA
jgi:uncharacterized RDD family membrane protein YckC/DNA-directed RNA polymerase subunit RPC12/RpoP